MLRGSAPAFAGPVRCAGSRTPSVACGAAAARRACVVQVALIRHARSSHFAVGGELAQQRRAAAPQRAGARRVVSAPVCCATSSRAATLPPALTLLVRRFAKRSRRRCRDGEPAALAESVAANIARAVHAHPHGQAGPVRAHIACGGSRLWRLSARSCAACPALPCSVMVGSVRASTHFLTHVLRCAAL